MPSPRTWRAGRQISFDELGSGSSSARSSRLTFSALLCPATRLRGPTTRVHRYPPPPLHPEATSAVMPPDSCRDSRAPARSASLMGPPRFRLPKPSMSIFPGSQDPHTLAPWLNSSGPGLAASRAMRPEFTKTRSPRSPARRPLGCQRRGRSGRGIAQPVWPQPGAPPPRACRLRDTGTYHPLVSVGITDGMIRVAGSLLAALLSRLQFAPAGPGFIVWACQQHNAQVAE